MKQERIWPVEGARGRQPMATRALEQRAYRTVRLAAPDDFDGWREAARGLALIGAAPDEVLWEVGGELDLFAVDLPCRRLTRREGNSGDEGEG